METRASSTRPRIRVGAIITHGERLLCVSHRKHGRQYWMPPGGGVDWGERLDEALQREVQEEVGYDIEVGPLLLIKESIPPDRSRHIVHLLFRAVITGGQERRPQDPRVEAYAYVDWGQLEEGTFFPDVLPQLLAVLADSTYTGAQYVGNTWLP